MSEPTAEMQPTVSVVLASYNGEQYIGEQLNSVLPFLSDMDELIVSDDGSTDATLEIVHSCLAKKTKKFKAHVIEGPGRGVQNNYFHALWYASSDIVCFCDQDDVWYPNKIAAVKAFFLNNSDINVLLHDARLIDSNGSVLEDSLLMLRNYQNGYFRNIIRSGYYGCCMAVRRQFLLEYLDGMSSCPAYDQYFGLLGEKRKTSSVINVPLIDHRMHLGNVSKQLTLGERIAFRIRLFLSTCLVR